MIHRIAPHVVDITKFHRSTISQERVRMTHRKGLVTVQLFGPRNSNLGAITVSLDDLKLAVVELEKMEVTA